MNHPPNPEPEREKSNDDSGCIEGFCCCGGCVLPFIAVMWIGVVWLWRVVLG